MLSIFDLMLVKESINHEKIIYMQFGKHDFVFRQINPKEHTQAKMLASSNEEFNDAICQLALISPVDYNFAQSNIGCFSDIMAKHIIEESHILNEKAVIEHFETSRQKLNMFVEQSFLFVKAAFPEYAFEEIKEFTYEKLMDMTAKAEYVLRLRGSQVELKYDEEYFDNLEEEQPRKSDAELVNSGVDPMFYYSSELELKKPFIDHPVIMGSDWKDEVTISNVRKQLHRR